jgi:predicted metal-dependent hydrolase
MLSGMQLDLPFLRAPVPDAAAVEYVRERRARRYILRVRRDGSLRVTIPRGGSRREAEAFLARHRQWADRERRRVAAAHAPREWYAGDTILLGGEPAVLHVEPQSRGHVLRLGGCEVAVDDPDGNVRTEAELALRAIAARDLVPRIHVLASRHALALGRVSIRNQQSRWGSCSRRGTIALNFRLVQTPPGVCDYVLLHELMHLRQPNHSRRFWRLVQEVCPGFRAAERWLREEGRSLF